MGNQNKGFFKVRDKACYRGTHFLIDLWGAKRLNSLRDIEHALVLVVKAIKATLREIRLHYFSPQKGISGVAILAESHISIHTWPEFDYAAVDIFVCGKVDPYKAIPIFKKLFSPQKVQISEVKRGIL